MSRRDDWPVRLQACINEWSAAPFEFGVRDCALFAAAAVEAMTGVDIADGLRGYSSEAEGLAIVRAAGFHDYTDVFTKMFPAADRLRVGDIAMVERQDVVAMGVVQVRGIYVMTPVRGLALVPRSWAKNGVTI